MPNPEFLQTKLEASVADRVWFTGHEDFLPLGSRLGQFG